MTSLHDAYVLNKVRGSALTLELDKLVKRSPKALAEQPVTAVIVALGSNYLAEYYLARAHAQLKQLGAVRLSSAFTNPDYTATPQLPKPDYTNQCAMIELTQPLILASLIQQLKEIEASCDRQRCGLSLSDEQQDYQSNQVTMDIDVLILKCMSEVAENEQIEQVHCQKSTWVILANRYPFKAHELKGLAQLWL